MFLRHHRHCYPSGRTPMGGMQPDILVRHLRAPVRVPLQAVEQLHEEHQQAMKTIQPRSNMINAILIIAGFALVLIGATRLLKALNETDVEDTGRTSPNKARHGDMQIRVKDGMVMLYQYSAYPGWHQRSYVKSIEDARAEVKQWNKIREEIDHPTPPAVVE
jgi:hypothetical protein